MEGTCCRIACGRAEGICQPSAGTLGNAGICRTPCGRRYSIAILAISAVLCNHDNQMDRMRYQVDHQLSFPPTTFTIHNMESTPSTANTNARDNFQRLISVHCWRIEEALQHVPKINGWERHSRFISGIQMEFVSSPAPMYT